MALRAGFWRRLEEAELPFGGLGVAPSTLRRFFVGRIADLIVRAS
jgi:hypothetical protein